MKKILVVVGLVVCSVFNVSAQVEQCDILGRYYESYEWSESKDTYILLTDGWSDFNFTIRDDFYILTIEDKEPFKIWWEYNKSMSDKADYECEIYFTKDGRKVIFKYSDQSMTFFSEWNEGLGRYTSATVITKTSKITGSEYEGNKQNEPTNIKRPF